MELIYESGTVAESCGNCHTVTQCDVAETLRGGKRRWDLECSCPACGSVWHAGGTGKAPERFRNAIISTNGKWTIRLDDPSSSGARLLQVLRGAHDCSISEAKQLAESLRTSGIQGTLVDVESLSGKLLEAGIPASIKRLEE
ncbi:hypothetical protein [Streptomyces cyaneofuscatus]|uniref:hypothetical protein n=1 Tax=Streptomyces cyaneofuscatus TaxID=66883 RepID=UPI0037D02A73